MKVALDVDGCCLNWFENICHWYKEPVIAHDWNADFITDNWETIKDTARYWEGLRPMGKVNFHFDVYLTSMPEKWLAHRKENLDHYKFPDKPVVIEYNKVEWCIANKFDVLVDDRPETVREAINRELGVIQVYPYYARYGKESGALSVSSISEIDNDMLFMAAVTNNDVFKKLADGKGNKLIHTKK